MTWEPCYATPIDAEAHVVKGFLEQYGVPCVLESDRFGVQPLTFCALGQVKVLVPGDWLRVARGLIDGRQTVRLSPGEGRGLTRATWRQRRTSGRAGRTRSRQTA